MRNIDCERLKQAVDEHTGADVLSGRVLGGAISVFQNGTTAYQACFGHADVECAVNTALDHNGCKRICKTDVLACDNLKSSAG